MCAIMVDNQKKSFVKTCLHCLQLQAAQSAGDKPASSDESGAAKKTESDVTVAAAAALSAAAVKAKVSCFVYIVYS